MLELPEDLLTHLQHGGALVVPTRQRATAVRLAYSATQLSAGRRLWDSPDIVSWSAWLERELDRARARGRQVPRRLSGAQEWLLWRDAAREACAGSEVLQPEGLIDALRGSASRLADYGVTLRAAESIENAVLARALAAYLRRCQELGAISSTEWPSCATWLSPSIPTWLAGFDELGPARRAWLEGLGIASWEPRAVVASSLELISCQDAAAEASAAAEWCARTLERDPRARLLLIVPRLEEQRALWERTLGQQLDGGAILEPASQSEPSYVIEGGQPLARLPLITTALQLIGLATHSAEFEQLSALLRSPYLGLERAARLRLDVWLRKHNVTEVQPSALYALLDAIATGLGADGERVLKVLLEALQAVRASMGSRAPSAAWARAFAALLERCGWPGTMLDGAEQQTRLRFDELLGEFAALDAFAGALADSEASALLRELALRTHFEPASHDVAVTLTASQADPIVHYEGLWVAGLAANDWPTPRRADPLLPLALQRAAGMPGADPAGESSRALRALRRWRGAGAHCVLSWPRSADDLPRTLSPLIEDVLASASPAPTRVEAVTTAPRLEAWIAAQAPPLERWTDLAGPAWPQARELRGGTRLLELQALCPFRAFAELRLKVPPLPRPVPGIDRPLRGLLVHQALQLFWSTLRDSRTLERTSAERLREIAAACAAQALNEALGPRRERLDAALLEREQRRTETLLLQLSEWERARAPFVTEALEDAHHLRLGGTTLRVRLDRVDRLDDGRLIVIDYKSGAHRPFDAYAERPTQPQLPAYALIAGESVAAVLALYVGREAVSVSGVADRSGRVPRVKSVAGGEAAWGPLLEQWRQRLECLVGEFLDGHAAVDPQPNACASCHLALLCRIDPRVAALAPEPEEQVAFGP